MADDLMAMGAGYPVIPVGLVGAGGLGDGILSLCAASGLDTGRIGRTPAAATSQTHVMNVPSDSRTFFYRPSANDLLDPSWIGVSGLAEAGVQIFYLGYLNLLAALDAPGRDGRPVAVEVLAGHAPNYSALFHTQKTLMVRISYWLTETGTPRHQPKL